MEIRVTTNRLGLLLACLVAGIANAAPAPSPQAPPQAFVQRYCVGCHNPGSKAGGLALDPAQANSAAKQPEVWEKVLRRVRARQMPPAGIPRPDEQTYDSVVKTLAASLDQRPLNPGRTDTFRRLNRTEYQNAIRDLLALDVDVTPLLPADESSHGFDNIALGALSPTLLERYLGAARTISRLAIGIASPRPGGDTLRLPPDLTQEEHFAELPFGTRGGTVMRHTFPTDAEYEFHIRLARDRNEHVEGLREPHQIELMLDGERLRLFTVQPAPGQDHSKVDQHLNLRAPVKAGPHSVAVAFLKKPSVLLETERQPYQAHFNMDRHPRPQPAVYSVTVNGPYTPRSPSDTPSRKRLFVCQPKSASEQDGCAERILTALMRRAYRRPVTTADLRNPMRFYREASRESSPSSFEQGIEMALRAVLVSPEFLFRVEQDPPAIAPKTAYAITGIELASRLSFFLWSSIPDDELLDLAAQGRLHDPAILERQTRRMLADPRASALAVNFAAQWLQLRSLAAITPDMRLFPDFDDNLRRAFRQETEMFFESLVREDRSVLDLLRADYTFLNERLAKHYGIPNIYGSRFRRVAFPPEGPRGGLLRQGSILTVTSYATRTSPVIRGKWVLDNLLGTSPPPPPPNVSTLKENAATGEAPTMRARLAAHRNNPACAGCHLLMDPPGFSLENYDAVGRWRITEASRPVDSAGGLPDGSRFSGPAALQKALLARPELLASTVTEKLMTYALGRGIELSDAPAVRKVVASAAPTDYRWSSMILGIVRSTPFQMRSSQ